MHRAVIQQKRVIPIEGEVIAQVRISWTHTYPHSHPHPNLRPTHEPRRTAARPGAHSSQLSLRPCPRALNVLVNMPSCTTLTVTSSINMNLLAPYAATTVSPVSLPNPTYLSSVFFFAFPPPLQNLSPPPTPLVVRGLWKDARGFSHPKVAMSVPLIDPVCQVISHPCPTDAVTPEDFRTLFGTKGVMVSASITPIFNRVCI